MKPLATYSIALLLVVLVTGCDRAFTPEIDSVTPPELHVLVRDADGNAVSGADVSLYRTTEDRDAGTNAFHTATTDSEGRVVATADDIGEAGVIHVAVTSDDRTGQGSTPYMLLTDGITLYTIVVQ